MGRKRRKTPTLREIHGDTRPKKKVNKRECLKCEKVFESTGPHHRLCDHCRHTNAANMDAYDI